VVTQALVIQKSLQSQHEADRHQTDRQHEAELVIQKSLQSQYVSKVNVLQLELSRLKDDVVNALKSEISSSKARESKMREDLIHSEQELISCRKQLNSNFVLREQHEADRHQTDRQHEAELTLASANHSKREADLRKEGQAQAVEVTIVDQETSNNRFSKLFDKA